MNSLFQFFVDNWKFSLLATVFTVLAGILCLNLLQRESFPPVNFAVVNISSVYPGASSEEVHDKLTKVIEDELRGIDGIKDVRSFSQNNLSNITVRIDIDQKNSDKVVSDIEKAVQRARSRLPAEVTEEPRVMEINAKEIPVLEMAIIGPNENRERDVWAENLKELIEDVNGVSNVRYSGYREKELQILIQKDTLNQYGISLAEVFQVLTSQIKNIPSGFIDDKKNVALVRVSGKNSENKDLIKSLENTAIRSNDVGRMIFLKDIGRVVFGYKKPNILASVNGEDATLLVVTKKAESDALKTLEEVSKHIETFQKKLPSQFKFLTYNDEGARIKNRLDIVNFNALSGMAIVIVILFFFLPGKIGLMSSLSLPISALGTVAFMVFYGANFNIITMIALVICLGNLVDNSVVISEYYTQLREEGVLGREAALRAAQQFWIPFTASTVTIVCAFLPMLVTKGVMGQFIMWIPIIVTIALGLSLVEAVTLLPARLQFLNPKKKNHDESTDQGLFFKLEEKFGSIVEFSLNHQWKTLGLLTILIASGVFVTAAFNRFELFPAEGVEYYVGRYKTPVSTSIYQTSELAKTLEKEVMRVMDPDVIESVVGKAGIQQTDPSDPRSKSGEHVGLIMVGIKPTKAQDLDIQKTLKTLNSITVPKDVGTIQFEPIENGPPVGKPLTITLRSTNQEQLEQIQKIVMNEFSQMKGVINLESDEEDTGVEYRFLFDEYKRSLSAVNTDLIGLNLRTALEGSVVQELTENGKTFDMVVRYEDADKGKLENLKKMSISNGRGTQIPLLSLGQFEKTTPPKTIKNYNYKKAITFSADVDNVNLTSSSANKNAEAILLKYLPQFPDVTYIVGGEGESTNESLESLMVALVLAIFGIFATLVFTFQSFSSPFLILSTIPLGLVGVFYSFTVVGRPLSFLAFIGVVGLTGVVINSAIILVDYINELVRDFPERPLKEILILASKKRLRAVLATGLTTVVGLIPTAFGWGGYDPVLVDITLALSWGMIIGTILSLFWIPSGYAILKNARGFLMKKIGWDN